MPDPYVTLISAADASTTGASTAQAPPRRVHIVPSHPRRLAFGEAAAQAWTTSIIEAEYRESTQTLAVSVSACNAHLSPEVVETSSEVRITVMAEGGDPGADCADGFEVRLERPLGGRQVVDDGDGGNVIAVTLDQ